MSRGALRALSARDADAGRTRSRGWRRTPDLDVLRIGVDEQQTAIALSEFIAERRLRKAA